MTIKFWGVRGSTPTPERRNSRYGGNTSCIEVRLAKGTLIILDCGSGFRALGKSLAREFGERPISSYIFLTHFHWDHIQGIPFFPPLYKQGNTFLFHSVLRQGDEVEAAIQGQMANPYFPVDMSVMAAGRHFYMLDESPISVNEAIVSSAPLHHPQGAVAYRIDADGGSFVLATDTEPGSPFHDRALRELAKDADVLVYDAQYTPEQLLGEKKGWGHSSWLDGTRIAHESGVKRLVLFHHDPDHDDAFIDGLVEKARQEFPHVNGAMEGMEIELPQGEIEKATLVAGSDRRRAHRFRLEVPVRLSWQESNGEKVEMRGLAQDVSKSGIYFIAPNQILLDRVLDLEIILPDEITHQGEVTFSFAASPVRQDQLNGVPGVHMPARGVGARLTLREESDASGHPKADTK